MPSHKKRAFTLIELLIVVAIIAILAAIAVPNFLEAQVRAKTSATRSDMRTLATALEAYAVDYNYYPLPAAIMASDAGVVYPMPSPMHNMYSHNFAAGTVTTPVAFLTGLPADPFARGLTPARDEDRFYYYMSFQYTRAISPGGLSPAMQYRYDAFGEWVMFACGPDRDRKDMSPDQVGMTDGLVKASYDPTNGTVSNGDIIRTQRGTEGPRL